MNEDNHFPHMVPRAPRVRLTSWDVAGALLGAALLLYVLMIEFNMF